MAEFVTFVLGLLITLIGFGAVIFFTSLTFMVIFGGVDWKKDPIKDNPNYWLPNDDDNYITLPMGERRYDGNF